MLPSSDDPIWRSIVLDDNQYDFKFFALKILMRRIKMRLEFEKGDNIVDECVDELYNFSVQYPEFMSSELEKLKQKELQP